ncbi:hypothetical protein FBPa34_0080 [Pseudomonas phage vB_PaeM_FBPa34]|uniref:Uncharacterized protein n=1 Tax=Pseudomonas phage vB_PaeM_FBPa35 TaxID=2969608 RepID=A0A9E7QQV1_9CAUD|nr:hypothetical protein FBPa2_0081 [Pseudomonas phage vB_PaeM_FBPa2]UVN13284.1 hypothetical protein FBPa10_0082 [Pseudomonas phage vB_PaeM_FBPa10]UVN13905.1 hypothetical protein FBPa34_0080 [Pseudomonas phage vB_PaeM_FBPa34]UVN13992.1 hypothetical protein FBPa35_0078 [Pseudomonas phage vB_PaeM_FBPa35]
MPVFNIEQSVTVEAEVEKGCTSRIAHLWDEEGNDLSCKLGVTRTLNVKAACAYLVRDPAAKGVTTECGVTIRRGKA